MGALSLVGILVVYYTYFYKAPVNWTESYSETRQDPFGTSILFQLLNGLSDGKGVKKVDNPLRAYLKRQDHGKHANYVFVGNTLNLRQADADSLFAFAQQGNDVFIAAENFPFSLNRKLHYNLVWDEEENYDQDLVDYSPDTSSVTLDTAEVEEEAYTEQDTYSEDQNSALSDSSWAISDTTVSLPDSTAQWPDSLATASNAGYIDQYKYLNDSLIHFHFTHPDLNQNQNYTFQYVSDFKHQRRSWMYLNDSVEADSGIQRTLLGYLQPTRPVYYRYKVGKGYIYFHTLPLTLTNLYLREELALDYVNKVFSSLRPGVVYWDNYHRFYTRDSSGDSFGSSPLKYLLSQPSLAWAWYLGLFSVGMFLLFFGKRQQKAIPILSTKSNTSIEFAQTLARFFKKGGYGTIAEVKAKNFKMYIWEKYKIPSDLPRQEYTALIAQYSGVEEVKISLIFHYMDRLRKPRNENLDDLLEFQKSIEYFYTHSK